MISSLFQISCKVFKRMTTMTMMNLNHCSKGRPISTNSRIPYKDQIKIFLYHSKMDLCNVCFNQVGNKFCMKNLLMDLIHQKEKILLEASMVIENIICQEIIQEIRNRRINLGKIRHLSTINLKSRENILDLNDNQFIIIITINHNYYQFKIQPNIYNLVIYPPN